MLYLIATGRSTQISIFVLVYLILIMILRVWEILHPHPGVIIDKTRYYSRHVTSNLQEISTVDNILMTS